MNNKNYQKELEDILLQTKQPKTLLLHACCAPCSSYVLEYLSQFFIITLYYYNPNITNAEEYQRRLDELTRLVSVLPVQNPVRLIAGDYDSDRFSLAAKGLEQEREGGARCTACYELRLDSTASLAAEQGFDYFTTTLSISPYKNAAKLNDIGERLAQQYGVAHLPCDFKKRGGYKRSVELSAQYGLYRQSFCGCIFSAQRSEPVQSAPPIVRR